MNPFNPQTIPLEKSNLVEASAGTGKTYSIAILVLRLLLEKNIPLPEIAMVTFTKAAVAELEQRIRLFIRLAYRCAIGEEIQDPTIQQIVKKSIQNEGQSGREAIVNRLQTAQLFLEDTSILTIHSFAQLVLKEFAFETLQLFNAEIITSVDDIHTHFVNEFWRKHITTIPVELLDNFLAQQLDRGVIKQLSEYNLSGKPFAAEIQLDANYLNPEHTKKISDQLNECYNQITQCKQAAISQLVNIENTVRANIAANAYAKKNPELAPSCTVEQLVDYYFTFNQQYLKKVFADIESYKEQFHSLLAVYEEIINAAITHIYALATREIKIQLERYKQHLNAMTFDDIIHNLHTAVTGSRKQLLQQALRKKYRAVFVDEFQDTDQLQYEIFHTVFGAKDASSILFYIGDPKQSIYGFRKADITTYHRCASEVNTVYTMDVNYRSSPAYISALNKFFLPIPGFNTFHSSIIQYAPVKPAPSNQFKALVPISPPNLSVKSAAAPPALSLIECKTKDDISEAVVHQVLYLLSANAFHLQTAPKQTSKIIPSDIGILVRSNNEGRNLKALLAVKGIKSVTLDDTMVLQSPEAISISYVLEAMVVTNRSTINKALLTSFTGYSIQDILELNEEQTLDHFRNYHAILTRDGIYPALNKFASDYKVRSLLLNTPANGGDRAIANFEQIMELLHKTQVQKQFSEDELLHWLKSSIENSVIEGDEFVQRIESDENAVKIVTIHKSKGLEYPIVIIPFLDLTAAPSAKKPIHTFKDDDQKAYKSVLYNLMTPEQISAYSQQQEQENRRLIYVALTRGIYKGYVFSSGSNKKSSMKVFFEANKEQQHPDIEYINASTETTYSSNQTTTFTNSNQPIKLAAPLKAKHFSKLQQTNWRKLSYTFLSGAHNSTSIPAAVADTPSIATDNLLIPSQAIRAADYDLFIYKSLYKGPTIGNLLHSIFEEITFNQPETWSETIADTYQRILPSKRTDWFEGTLQLVRHTLNTNIPTSHGCMKLSNIENQQHISELEFNFTVSPFHVNQLQDLSTPEAPFHLAKANSLEGIMNGKVDLFFEYQQRFYILDWKSNFLGDSIEQYTSTYIHDAMNQSNYHLQYLIYTLALKKYLSSRMSNFEFDKHFGGVIYLFLRGCREDQSTGVYFTRPNIKTIEQIETLFRN